MKLIDNAWVHFHRSWAVRASLAFGVFTGVLMGLPAFVETLNPLVFMGLAVFFNVAIIPLARIVKQAEAKPPAPVPPVVA
jgi:hypothetical protein